MPFVKKKPSQMDQAKISCAAALPNKQTSSVPIANIDVHCDHYHDIFKCVSVCLSFISFYSFLNSGHFTHNLFPGGGCK